jgi:hypothetical protein
VIEDLEGARPELSPMRSVRPRVSSEPIGWAFLSALGAAFIVGGIADIALSVLWPVLLPSTQSHPAWLSPGAVSAVARFIAMAAVAMRTGHIGALALCVGYQAALDLARLPVQVALCERSSDSGPSIPCGLAAIARGAWPTWLALAVGVAASRELLPAPRPGANMLLRAAGAFAFAPAIVAILWQFAQSALFNGLPAIWWLSAERPGGLSWQVGVSTAFLFVQLFAGLLAGVLLRGARSGAVLLLALLVAYGAAEGIALVRHNVETGVPHVPLELAYLQSLNALSPATGILGIALGRLLRPARAGRRDDAAA